MGRLEGTRFGPDTPANEERAIAPGVSLAIAAAARPGSEWAPSAGGEPWMASRWYALGLLSAMYFCHAIDRFMMGVIVEPIKHEFHLTDASVGLLTGIAYSTAFSIACAPIGWLADRVNRRNLLIALLSLWSGLTALCGTTTTFATLVTARVAVGLAEAGGQPLALSLISDLFGPKERSTAIGYLYVCVAAGISTSFFVGGALAAHFGWRSVCFVAGIPGLMVAALLFLTFREPPRGRPGAEAETQGRPPRLREVAAVVVSSPTLLHIGAGITITAIPISATWLWMSSFMIRQHHLPLQEVGVIAALGAIAQGAGSGIIGKIADYQSRISFRRLALVAAVTTAISGVLGLGYAFAASTSLAVTFFMLVSFSLGAYLGPSFSVLLSSVPSRMRAVVAGTLQVTINLIGTGLGPYFTGLLSDLFGGPDSLRPALGIILCINFWAALHFLLAFRAMGRNGHALHS